MKISRNNNNIRPADYNRRAGIYVLVRIGWFAYQMSQAQDGQVESVAQGLYRYALRDGRGMAVTRMAHLIGGALTVNGLCHV